MVAGASELSSHQRVIPPAKRCMRWHGGGVSPTSHAYQRGVSFLLTTQKPDGSWFVASRTPEIQAYFEGGFPYGHDQWISSWGTAWAAIALTQALPAEKHLAMSMH